MNLEISFTIEGQSQQTVPVRDRMLIGTLLSNDVVIRADGVEPIHAMIEILDSDRFVLTDLGSEAGVLLNANKINVEQDLKKGDVITIGNVDIRVEEFGASTKQMATREGLPPVPPPMMGGEVDTDNIQPPTAPKAEIDVTEAPTMAQPEKAEVASSGPVARESSEAAKSDKPRRRSKDADKDLLFSPRHAKPSGDVLEVVSYWGDTILDVELFHPTIKGQEKVTVGVPPKANFLSGSKKPIVCDTLAYVQQDGFQVELAKDMKARIRKGGKIAEKKGSGSITLGSRDIIHIKQGALRYFMMFIKPPKLNLPKRKSNDKIFIMMQTIAALLYFVMVPAIYYTDAPHKDKKDEDTWAVVEAPKKLERPKPKPKKKPKPKVKVAKKKPKPKPKPKPKKPPKPLKKPKPVKPKKVVKKKNPKKRKIAKKPSKVKPKSPLKRKAQGKPAGKPGKLAKLNKSAGMVKTGAKKPNFKLPGRNNGNKKGLSGGKKGGGKRRANSGGRRKGNQKVDLMGVKGGVKGKASGVNLKKLGFGAGKVLNKTGAGAIKTNFKTAAGGAGGGAGSGRKNYGLGGPGNGRALGVSGTGGALNNFGGYGGNGSGSGGSGGYGSGLSGRGAGGGAFGRGGAGGRGGSGGRANVAVPPGDPLVEGGLTTQEVQNVIRANLNQIRHCYEQLLQRSPSSSGKIKVKFTVARNGRVSGASILSSSIRDSKMKSCVTSKVRRWKFPKPRGGKSVKVNYPFVFNPI